MIFDRLIKLLDISVKKITSAQSISGDEHTQLFPMADSTAAKMARIATTLIARFMGPSWGPSGADRTQVGPMLAP